LIDNDLLDDQIKYLTYNWFRSECGVDESIVEGISMGETIAPVVWQGLAHLSFEYFQCKGSNEERVHLATDSSRIRFNVNKRFNKMVVAQDEVGHFRGEESYLEVEKIPHVLLRKLFRLLQLFAKRFIVGKRLFIDSRMTQSLESSNSSSIRIYKKSLLAGAVPVIKKDHLLYFERAIPKNLSFLDVAERLKVLNENLDIKLDALLVTLFSEYIEEKFIEMRSGMIQAIALFKDIADFYKPKSCVIPTDLFPNFLIYAQICRNKNIESIGAMDGFPSISISPIARGIRRDDWLFVKFIAYGRAHQRSIENLGYLAENIILCQNPLKIDGLTSEKKYECIIFTWFPNVFSCSSDHQSTPSTLRSAIKSVTELGARRIGVKIKTDAELGYVNKVAAEFEHISEIYILTGATRTHLLNCEFAIGGISTAIAEASINQIPYYIFEPLENGYSDAWISKSDWLTPSRISRNFDELQSSISGGKCLDIGSEIFL